MNLLAFREKFRAASGRFELVNEDFTDNGADFFINEGSRYLDRMEDVQKSFASHFRFIDIGGFSASFPHCRSLQEVWIHTSTGRWQLEKMDYADLIANYLSGLPSSRSSGKPSFYSPTITRYIPSDIDTLDFEAYAGFVDIPAIGRSEYNSIILNSPIDEKMSVELKGLFYSHELSADEHSNYWTDVHPMLLIMSTMRQLEIINRNTQGVNDWTRSIVDQMKQLGMDLVAEIVSGVDQMVG